MHDDIARRHNLLDEKHGCISWNVVSNPWKFTDVNVMLTSWHHWQPLTDCVMHHNYRERWPWPLTLTSSSCGPYISYRRIYPPSLKFIKLTDKGQTMTDLLKYVCLLNTSILTWWCDQYLKKILCRPVSINCSFITLGYSDIETCLSFQNLWLLSFELRRHQSGGYYTKFPDA